MFKALALGSFLASVCLQVAGAGPLTRKTTSVPVVGSSLNILIEGQSNAAYFAEDGGAAALAAKVEALLGFDGIHQTVTILGGHDESYWGNTFLIGGPSVPPTSTWINGSASLGWTDATIETQFIAYLRSLPASTTSKPTVILWMHNENDSIDTAVTLADWESAIRYNVAATRSVFGQSAATTPLDIVYVPFDWNPGVEQSAGRSPEVQVLKSGFEALAADPLFGATIAAQVGDSNMDGPPKTVHPYGAKHFDQTDIDVAASRIAITIANQFWHYALPGSKEAFARGTLDSTGPQVITAAVFGTNRLLIELAPSMAGPAIATLSAAASKGAGWSVVDGSAIQYATAALRVGRKLTLTFANSLPHTATARLYYGWGTGRIFVESAPPVPGITVEGPGQGSAVYDLAGQPAWTAAGGVPLK